MLQQYKTNFDMGKNVGWHEVNYVGHLICSGLDLIPTNLSLKKKKKSRFQLVVFKYVHIFAYLPVQKNYIVFINELWQWDACWQLPAKWIFSTENLLSQVFCVAPMAFRVKLEIFWASHQILELIFTRWMFLEGRVCSESGNELK